MDGDTLRANGILIRLALIDAPERGEKNFEKAKNFVESICPAGSQIKVDQDNLQPYDKYGRLVATVYCKGKNLNTELLKAGYATLIKAFCNQSEFSSTWAKEFGC